MKINTQKHWPPPGAIFFFASCYMWYKNYKETGDVTIKKRMTWIPVIRENKRRLRKAKPWSRNVCEVYMSFINYSVYFSFDIMIYVFTCDDGNNKTIKCFLHWFKRNLKMAPLQLKNRTPTLCIFCLSFSHHYLKIFSFSVWYISFYECITWFYLVLVCFVSFHCTYIYLVWLPLILTGTHS